MTASTLAHIDREARELLLVLALAHRELDRNGVPPAAPRPIDGRPIKGDS